jgi:uncharacterized RDD family membrane protein YckC
MRRREIAFLLIGLGVGLAFSAVAIVGWVLSYSHHMFIIGIQWGRVSVLIALPFLLVLLGFAILFRSKGEQSSN